MPDEVAPMSVLSLLLPTKARRDAGTDGDGNPIVLAEQDRAAWDAAASYRETNWAEIVRLYDLLIEVHPSSAAHLARAAAVAENSGVAAGLDLLGELDPDQRWHAVRAELLARDGRFGEAINEMTASLAGPTSVSDAEAGHRRKLIARWTQ